MYPMGKQYKSYFSSPIGILEIISNETAVIGCTFVETEGESSDIPQILKEALNQLEIYFKGKRTTFDLKLRLEGTEFQKHVWKELQNIPFGYTVSYQEVAKRIGKKKAVRAVGNANGKNPISVIIPCHRVIGSDSKLVGYRGGIEKKRWLIQFEKSILVGHMH